jgi:hypothetical protein
MPQLTLPGHSVFFIFFMVLVPGLFAGCIEGQGRIQCQTSADCVATEICLAKANGHRGCIPRDFFKEELEPAWEKPNGHIPTEVGDSGKRSSGSPSTEPGEPGEPGEDDAPTAPEPPFEGQAIAMPEGPVLFLHPLLIHVPAAAQSPQP